MGGVVSSADKSAAISLPYQWSPRDYQVPFWSYLVSETETPKRSLCVWARQHGKDECCLHFLAWTAIRNPGTYLYMFPTQRQARKVIWNMVNKNTGRRRVFDAFIGMENEGGLIRRMVDDEMTLHLVNNSVIQFCGSDNYDSLVGASPRGMIFSEWALCDGAAWDFLKPALKESKGFAIFVTTPRGQNHAHDMYRAYKDDPEWHVEVLPASKANHLTPQDLEKERADYIKAKGFDYGDALYRQEYEVSWSAGIPGAYFAREMEQAEQEGRITTVPHDARYPVYTSWDIGTRDSEAVWCWQVVGSEIFAIDYIENSNVEAAWYVRELHKRPYTYKTHFLPHDAANRHQAATNVQSYQQILRSLGLSNLIVLPRTENLRADIDAVRAMIPKIKFDKAKCERGIQCLRNYSRRWDESRKVYADAPLHDQFSNGADSARMFACAQSYIRTGPTREIKYSNAGIV